MADEGLRMGGGLYNGLAVVLKGKESSNGSGKSHLVSYCESFGEQPVERAIEHIFDLPYKAINHLNSPVNSGDVRTIIRHEFLRHHQELKTVSRNRDGVCTIYDTSQQVVGLDESSICGDIRILNQPLLVESDALFSSVRANACVWKGKWMYEVTLETCGAQKLGWAIACPFTERKGVGDLDDSYAFDGKRVCKRNKETDPYGQGWVVGDVIGCCIDMDSDEILFYRNGTSLGVAFTGIRKMVPGLGYYPAISLSQGERCEINFGGLPFKYPIKGFLPIQAPPPSTCLATNLFDCFLRLLQMQCPRRLESNTIEKLSRLKRFASFEELYNPVSKGICEELFSALNAEIASAEYIGHGPFLSFMMEAFRIRPPHDYLTLNRVLDSLLGFDESKLLFGHAFEALSGRCKTAPLVLTECPYSGSYSYLALACHMLRREELMTLWWNSDFQFLFEGFLSRKGPNKQDLQSLIPSVWWPGSYEDISNENNMMLTTTALSEAINKIEEKQRDLCRLVMQFIPPVGPVQLPGSVFRTFLQSILLKNRGADRNVPPPGLSNNTVLVSLFSVLLHFLSEGFAVGDIYGWIKGSRTNSGTHVGFLHRGGQQSFPAGLFVKNDPHRVDIPRLGGSYSHLSKFNSFDEEEEEEIIRWEEGCMDDEEMRVTHFGRQKPCCCFTDDGDSSKIFEDRIRCMTKGSQGSCSSIPDKSTHVTSECSAANLNDEIVDKPSTSDHSESEFAFRPMQQLRIVPKENAFSSATLEEEELLDTMLLLYHLGLAPNFKQASSFMSRQSQSISLLEETDRQIRECIYSEQVKRLREARSVYREEVVDCIRHSAWYRVSLFSRWKQRGMYATCMWIVQLLLVLSKGDPIFSYVPEYYLETLVDCFHVLRKSDPPFVPATIFIKQGLAPFVTFIVTHFNDPRIASAELRDLLLQSISVLVQYKEYLVVFERNEAATRRMPKALLSAFDNRSWIPVTNILLRLCKGSGFGLSNRGESSSSSILFQTLLKETCTSDEELFSAFLNRLFNTLSWAMTEFSVSVREMQENYKMMDMLQRKCSVIFDLSCNLARVLEFCTGEIPQAFVSGMDTNLRRLAELIVFMLTHLIGAIDPEVFDLLIRRPGQSSEKMNGGMIFAPLAGIILNLLDANRGTDNGDETQNNDVVAVFASMDCASTIRHGVQYLLEYNWAGSIRSDDYSEQLKKLENFSTLLMRRTEIQEMEKNVVRVGETEGEVEAADDGTCCICYSNKADTSFEPCKHISCHGCISRHLLNCERCFFCNTTIVNTIGINSSK
ncbi:E3 ubiquitin-protein ligase RKP [Andrographis paniculata]|uniref:E3 ubiquitin-protein ligase RKP n=1 Tax=Andrographis paniculata TaxID=175694 RepID=UPI0021E94E49|nr:E3 ubiquitin-protein ligase RKP [Andrographis paniculata]XP_051140369.1 E3 ubiquitin-protein ligase RKP [Andrographis paniculata]XP_051140370.1 E3 ubiquitin-protein ligase RKP [Andrographis paniculata]